MKRLFPIILTAMLILAVTLTLSGCGGSNNNNDGPPGSSTKTYHLYVVDNYNNRIIGMTDMNGTNWTAFGSKESNHFKSPSSVFVGNDGKIYVADTGNNRIVRMDDLTGTGLTSFGGLTEDEFKSPSSVFVGSDGKIYVADTGNKRIVCMDNMSGTNWKSLTGFFGPRSVFVDSSGKIYVLDTSIGYMSRIVRTNGMDDTETTNWDTFTLADGNNPFLSSSFFVGINNKIYVAESEQGRILCMDDMDGTNLTTFDGPTGDKFSYPTSVFVGSDNKIYVTDAAINDRRQLDSIWRRRNRHQSI